MSNDIEKLEGKLIESLGDKELGKLAKKYANISVYDIFDSKVLSDIPIINTIIGLAKSGFNVRDCLFIKKVVYFLYQIGNTTQEEREKFIEDNCQDTRQFEEAVLLMLEQADNMEKSSLIGKIFKACIIRKIKYEDALRLSDIVNRVFWSDLKSMFDGIDSKEQRQRLFISGLYKMKGKQQVLITDDTFAFQKDACAFALQKIYNGDYNNLEMVKS